MFGMTDLLTVCVIEEAFEFLSRNPHHLEFILCAFIQNKRLSEKVGPEHIKQCIDFITNNKIEINTYYEADLEKMPSIVVVSSGNENQKFLGDQGISIPVEVNRPVTYASWTASSVDGDTMTVPSSLKLDEKLWPGLIIVNEDTSIPAVLLEGILKGSPTSLCLNAALPDGVPCKGWSAISSGSHKKYQLSASKDDVRVQCKLTTNGDMSIHRLLSIALRWALKKYRLRFDTYGMIETTFSYTPPVVVDSEQHIFESVYTIDAQFVDHWIEKEWDTLPQGFNFAVCSKATNEDEEKDDVTLD